MNKIPQLAATETLALILACALSLRTGRQGAAAAGTAPSSRATAGDGLLLLVLARVSRLPLQPAPRPAVKRHRSGSGYLRRPEKNGAAAAPIAGARAPLSG